MSMMVSFVLSFFPRDVLDEILNLIESVSEDFPSYSCFSELIQARASSLKVYIFYDKAQASETPHSVEFLLFIFLLA